MRRGLRRHSPVVLHTCPWGRALCNAAGAARHARWAAPFSRGELRARVDAGHPRRGHKVFSRLSRIGVLSQADIHTAIFRDPIEAAEHWQRAERSGQGFLFQSYPWGSIWLDTIGRALRAEPCLVRLTYAGGELFLPMAIETKALGVRRLGFLSGNLSDHTGPIIVGDLGALAKLPLPKLARKLAAQAAVDVVDWHHLTSPIAGNHNPLITTRSRPASYLSHRLDIEESWPSFMRDKLSSSHLAGSRRRWRRLCAQGDPSFVIAAEPSEALTILEATMRHKAERYRATGRANPFEIEAYAEFYREMTIRHLQSGLVHVSALMLDGNVIASHWGCVYRKRFFWLMPAYDAVWGRYSPGRLLLDHLVEWSFNAGLEAFDFTIGDEPYKNTFANRHEQLYRSLYPRTALGLAYALKDRLKWPPIA